MAAAAKPKGTITVTLTPAQARTAAQGAAIIRDAAGTLLDVLDNAVEDYYEAHGEDFYS